MKTYLLGPSLAALTAGLVSLMVPAAQAARTAAPGTVNYVEGAVSLDGRSIGTNQNGNLAMRPNQVISTRQGKAEVLLSPGAYFRMGNNSQARTINAGLSDPQVELMKGEAMVEVDYKPKMANLDVMERGADTRILKQGLYQFDADEGKVAVVDGKASVTDNGQSKEFGKGKEVLLTGAVLKPVSFDRNAGDDLYGWSNVRASYEAEANASSASTVYLNGGWGMGYGPGWFWNPWFSTYAWLPGDGFFYSPFGYPFYSPGYIVYAPRFRGVYSPGFRGGVRPLAPRAFAGAPRAAVGGGFRGGGFGGGRGFRR